MMRQRLQYGLTLTELLISLALGALLALGVINVFLANRESSTVENALSRVQQSGRAAVELVNKDIRRAGYTGCTSIGGTVDVAATGLVAQRLLAFSANASTLAPDPAGQPVAILAGEARAGTDVVAIQYSDFLGADLIAAGDTFDTIGGSITLDDQELPDESRECALSDGDLVLFSNCLTTHIFAVSAASGCGASNTITINASDNAGVGAAATFTYGEGSDVAEYLQFFWFVADTGRDVRGVDVYALYRLASGQPFAAREEMVEGVEFLRVELGERIGGSMRYVTPVNVTNWDNVESVRYAMLVQSFDPVSEVDDTTTYPLLNTTVPPTGTIKHSGGRFVRRVYTSSQAIRNTDYGT
jgi:type IV pilus assembly protein PilW